jgi:hypothetical protein
MIKKIEGALPRPQVTPLVAYSERHEPDFPNFPLFTFANRVDLS